MRVRLLRTALRKLDDEATCIAVDDSKAANVVVERVLRAVAILQDQPSIGRPERVPATRELVVPDTRYVVPYRVREDVIEFLPVFRMSRRPPQRS